MYNICTSIKQSKRLIELGIDVNTADMYWAPNVNIIVAEPYITKTENETLIPAYDGAIPAWSLTALMELMNRNCYNVSLNCHGAEWNVKFDDSENYKDFTKDYAVDAAFEMVVWLLENKKL